MPRRLFFKDNGISDELSEEGYKLIGFKEGVFTEVGTNSVTKIIDEVPKIFILARNKFLYKGGPVPNGFDSLTGKDLPKFLPGNQSGFFGNDYDLSFGNYSQIIVSLALSKSLKLPNTKFGENLAQLWLQGGRIGTQSCEVDFTKYPNLGWCLIAGNQGHVRTPLIYSGLDDYENDWKPNYLITSSEINLPFCGVLWLGLTDDSLWTRFSNPVQKIYVYSDTTTYLSSVDLTEVNLDFSGFTWSSPGNFYTEDSYKFPVFLHELQISCCINLTDINIQNLPSLENNPDSNININFTNNNLTKSSIDGILQSIDEAYGITFSSNPVLSLGKTHNGDEPSLSGDFVVGQKYLIKELQLGDNFSNVGYDAPGSVVSISFDGVGNSFPIESYSNQTVLFSQNTTTGVGQGLSFEIIFDSLGNISSYTIENSGKEYQIDDEITTNDPYAGSLNLKITDINTGTVGEFTATGTTPNNWSNATTVYFGSSFGTGKGFTMSYLDGDIQDGVYLLPDLAGKGSWVKAEFISNTITRYEFLGSPGSGGTQYVGSSVSISLDYFTKFDELGRTIWQGNPTASLILQITEIATNASPTDGENNLNYISLLNKGWSVFISVS